MASLALDLYCGAGGASVGIHRAGYDLIGVDNRPQPSYPFDFIQEDAVEFMENGLDDFDFIWASPPCQAYSVSSASRRKEGYEYADMIEVTRHHLQKSGKPYIIENVIGAPLLNSKKLCGTMFPGLKVFRHRLFESNIDLVVDLVCDHTGHEAMKRRGDGCDFYTVAGHWPGTLAEWSDAMGIDWMKTKYELSQAIPPAYAEYLVKQVR